MQEAQEKDDNMQQGRKEYSILRRQLEQYCSSGMLAMHMPGHKRLLAPVPGLPYEWDVTEVEGVDDLHHAEGILQEAMDRTAQLVGSRRTWYLVNGSTCGNLAAIYAAVPRGGEIIVARNCHKSVYHAVEILGLSAHFLEPERIESFDIWGAMRPEAVEKFLEMYPAAAAVVVTSPTYEGVVSDIKGIAEAVHRAGKVLLVDEAHGAHFGLQQGGFAQESKGENMGGRPYFPDSAVHLGADVVVQSAHKTLPSLTQTALLHLCSDRVPEETLEHGLDIFETSSPSYPLMASLDGCTGFLKEEGSRLFAEWAEELAKTRMASKSWTDLKLLGEGDTDALLDPSKLLLRSASGHWSGAQLGAYLREQENIEPEMCCGQNVLLMTSCADSAEVWERLRKALDALDRALCQVELSETAAGEAEEKNVLWQAAANAQGADARSVKSILQEADAEGNETEIRKSGMNLDSGKIESVPLQESVGHIAAEYVMAYPPGIPILIPGERITQEAVDELLRLQKSGTRLYFSVTGSKNIGKELRVCVALGE